MPRSNGSVTIADSSKETSTSSITLQDVNAAGSNYGSVTQDLDEVKDAILTLIRGEVRKTELGVVFPESEAAVTNPDANREAKWLVTMKDTTAFLDGANLIANPGFGKLFQFEVATPDLSLKTAGTDDLDITTPAAVGTLAAAVFAANVRSPYNRSAGAGVTPTNEVVSIRYVGRNN